VALSDAQFRIAVVTSAVVLVAGLTATRFCGGVALPPKPEPPSAPTGPASQLVARSAATGAMYQDFLARDAAAAGVRAPSVEDMQKKLPYRSDQVRHVIEVGQPPIELAGVRLATRQIDDRLVLEIENLTQSDLAYFVETTPIPRSSACGAIEASPHNAMVIARGGTERRVECSWRADMALAVTRVETLEVGPLSAWYLSLVPPRMVGVEDRIARAHRGAARSEACTPVVSQAVRGGLERGEIGWRDLADFYARHRCSTYRFPPSYRAFKADGEREVPAVDPGM